MVITFFKNVLLKGTGIIGKSPPAKSPYCNHDLTRGKAILSYPPLSLARLKCCLSVGARALKDHTPCTASKRSFSNTSSSTGSAGAAWAAACEVAAARAIEAVASLAEATGPVHSCSRRACKSFHHPLFNLQWVNKLS
jgi:hypothetical protein